FCCLGRRRLRGVSALAVAASLCEALNVREGCVSRTETATEKRNSASGYDRILYESERKRSYEGRTASRAAISATRRRHWRNWASTASSSNKKSCQGNERDVGPNER